MKRSPGIRITGILLCLLLLCGILPPPTAHAAEEDSNLLIVFTYPDIQANKNSYNNAVYGSNSTAIDSQQISSVYLAKNEHEGFQIYVAENNADETGIAHSIRIELDGFMDDENHELDYSIYKEMYLGATNVISDPLAEVLVPYRGEWIENGPAENQMFYVDLHSTSDQPAGEYWADIRVYIDDDEEEPYLTQSFTATVWNFTLPEGHYSSLLAGLHNTASGYGATRGFLEGCGVEIDSSGTPTQTPENLALAEAVLEGWDEVMLEHGVNSYELPRWLIDNDPKAAQLAMADVRRQYVGIPILSYSVSNGSLTAAASEKIAQYRELVKGSEILQNKAYFYSKDEAGWTADEQADSYRALVAALRNVWTEDDTNGLPSHNLVTYNGAGDYDVCMNVFRETADILVLAHDFFRVNQSDENVQRVRGDYLDGSWYKILRYTTGIEAGSARLYRYKKSLTGLWRRIYFWQQAILGDDGILTWNSAWISYPNGQLYNVWETGMLPARNGVQGDNGDGVLLYPAGQYNEYFGLTGDDALDVTEPLMSLRFKQLSAGLDDYDYVQLAKEVLGEEAVQQLYEDNMVMNTLRETGKFANMWDDVIDWAMGPGRRTMVTWRQSFGEALDAAVAGEEIHDWGNWVTVVEPDATHEGMEIRSCANCGAQQSRRFVNTEPIETDDLRLYSSITVGTDMVVTFTARKTDVENYDRFWIEAVKHGPEGDAVYTYGVDQEEALTENTASWQADFRHIFAKEMGVEIEARLYARDADGQVWMSPAKSTNIRDYLGGRLTATNNKVEQRVLAADMLNYGAAAQMLMGFETDHLVNRELSAAQLAKLRQYETKTLPVVEKTNTNYQPEGVTNVLFTSVTLGNEVLLTLTVRAGEIDEVRVLVKDHDTGTVLETLDTARSGSSWSADYRGLGAEQMRVAYDFTAQINGVETGNTRTWSIEGYVGEIRNGSLPLKTAMANALLTYGDSAAAFLTAQ